MPTFFYSYVCLSLTLGLLSGCATESVGPTTAESLTDEQRIEQQIQQIPESKLDKVDMVTLREAELALYGKDIEGALSLYEQLSHQTRDKGIARRAVEIATASGDPFQILDTTLIYLDLAPNDDQAIELATRALARSAEIEAAWALLSEYPEKTYELRMVAIYAIRLAKNMQDNYQIEWLLEQVEDAYRDIRKDTEIQLTLGLLHEALGDFDTAAVYAQAVNEAQPDNLLALRLHANSLVRAGQKDRAANLITQWIMNHPTEAEARISLAQLLASFDSQAALPMLEMLSGEYPGTSQLLVTSAQIHLGSESPDKAIPYYQQLIQFDTYRNLAFFNLGRIYERQGDIQIAIKYYNSLGTTAVSEEDANMLFEAQLRLATISYQLGNDGSSLFTQLRDAYPQQASELIRIEAQLLLDSGKHQAAIDILTMGIENNPEEQTLLYSRSITFEQIDNIAAAINDLRTILAFDDSNPIALNALGYILANQTSEYQEAYELIDRALSIEPDSPAILDSMGWVLYRLGRHEEALDFLQRAHAELMDEEVIVHLAEVLSKLERLAEAKTILQQGMDQLPSSQLIPETRTRLGLDN